MCAGFTLLILAGLTGPAARAADEKTPAKVPALPAECLVLPPVGQSRRSPVYTDLLQAAIVAGRWKAPRAGDTVTLPSGTVRKWEALKPNKDGAFAHTALRGGYAYLAVPAEEDGVLILEAGGHGMVYVNGEPRPGDPYQTGYVKLPIRLHKGTNDLLFHVSRGQFRAKLTAPKAAAIFNTADLTLPDLVVGEPAKAWGAVVVLNTTPTAQTGVAILTEPAGKDQGTVLPNLVPLTARKVGFRLDLPAPKAEGKCDVQLKLVDLTGLKPQVLDTAAISLRVRKPEQTRKRTFISDIDGSVQYYAHVPARLSAHGENDRQGLVLTLHGAGVEAVGQADCYAPKPGLHVVAPTNRRPFGFDWEDWGRLDALEVLGRVEKELDTDPRRVYLTGHSMGGHGTWHLGVTYPNRFAAIAPSAGWISMWSYAGARRSEQASPLVDLVQRAAMPSDTLALAQNTSHHGIYILHGDKDDNVPVGQARTMKQRLAAFHHDLEYHEEAGAGHWWGKANVSGAACVDWPPIFDFFGRHRIPSGETIREVTFITASPGVSARSHWAAIEAQERIMMPSSIRLRCDPEKRQFTGTTENVARLALDLGHLRAEGPVRVELDDQVIGPIPWPKEKRLWLIRGQGQWAATAEPSAALKGPHRYGPFKEAFRYRVVFVYGTQGTAEDNAWALAKARYDAETFWYRGNGSITTVPDTEFLKLKDPECNVILYGNADGNAVWKALLADSPVQVKRGTVRVGERELKGADLGCLFVRPRPGSSCALVGVVAGTALAGMKLTDRLPLFVSGVGYPDCLVLGPEMLSKGMDGVRLAGFFGNDWGVPSGEFHWGK
jgi:poly(3-hydroxybutyrate) depolymerase